MSLVATQSQSAVKANRHTVRKLAGLQEILVRSKQRVPPPERPLSLADAVEALRARAEAYFERRSGSSDIHQTMRELLLLMLWISEVYGAPLPRLGQATRKTRDAESLKELETSLLQKIDMVSVNLHYYEHGLFDARIDAIPPLSTVLPEVQAAVCDFLGQQKSDGLQADVEDEALHAMKMVAKYPINPAREPCLAAFEPIKQQSYCPFAKRANLWGARDFNPALGLAGNIRKSADLLSRFTRAAKREPLDGLVMAFPNPDLGGTIHALSDLLRTTLSTLIECDPNYANSLAQQPVHTDEWRFSFGNEDYFVPVFAPIYGPNHPRFTHQVKGLVFLVFQPNSSFHRRLAGNKSNLRNEIRQKFSDGLQPYGQKETVEVERFLPRTSVGCPGASLGAKKGQTHGL